MKAKIKNKFKNNEIEIEVKSHVIENYTRIKAEERIRALSLVYDKYDLTAHIVNATDKYVDIMAKLSLYDGEKKYVYTDIVRKSATNPDNIATACTIAKSRAIASAGILIEYGISSLDEIKTAKQAGKSNQIIRQDNEKTNALHDQIKMKEQETLSDMKKWINNNVPEEYQPYQFIKRLTKKTAKSFIDAAKNNELDEKWLIANGYWQDERT